MTTRTAAADLAAYLSNSPDVRLGDLGGLNVSSAIALGSAAEAQLERAGAGVVSQSIILPLPPSANLYWRHGNGRTYVSEDARAYKGGVWLQAQHAGLRPFDGDIAVYVHVYRARKAGDLDNANKVLLDALCGIAYHDDAQIVELHSWRHDDKANPRVEVEVRRIA